MREIKFRVWDRGEKLMGNVNWLCPRDREVFKVRGWFGGEDKELIGSQFELMQYTGLKDKNGKEIYEGDIVFCEDGEFSKTCKIEWDEVGARFFGIAIEDDDSYEMQEIYGEIIGNIYKNPELLTN